MIKIYEPYRIADSLALVRETLETSRLTYQNKEFELVAKRLTEFHKKRTVPVFNGTCATHLAFKAMKMKVPNLKRVIVPNNVYVAAWNSMLMDGEIELVPVDADDKTWCVNTNKLCEILEKSDPEETGVLIVHNVGGVVNVPRLKKKFSSHIFIEDNCEGFLGEYEGMKTGTASTAASISFYANKTITCGEGGALIVDSDLHEHLNRTHSQGQTQERYIHDILAYNYRMTNTQAAILLSQLNILNEIVEKKKNIFDAFKLNLSKHFEIQQNEEGTKHSNWMLAIRIRGFDYHKNLENMSSMCMETRPMFYPMSFHAHLKKYAREETVASSLSKECFMIPSHPGLSEGDVEKILHNLNGLVE